MSDFETYEKIPVSEFWSEGHPGPTLFPWSEDKGWELAVTVSPESLYGGTKILIQFTKPYQDQSKQTSDQFGGTTADQAKKIPLIELSLWTREPVQGREIIYTGPTKELPKGALVRYSKRELTMEQTVERWMKANVYENSWFRSKGTRYTAAVEGTFWGFKDPTSGFIAACRAATQEQKWKVKET